jgi:hypothetical protein
MHAGPFFARDSIRECSSLYISGENPKRDRQAMSFRKTLRKRTGKEIKAQLG